eukprot:2439297-Rhodomonas_salina.2
MEDVVVMERRRLFVVWKKMEDVFKLWSPSRCQVCGFEVRYPETFRSSPIAACGCLAITPSQATS